jgi:hypothetical protein
LAIGEKHFLRHFFTEHIVNEKGTTTGNPLADMLYRSGLGDTKKKKSSTQGLAKQVLPKFTNARGETFPKAPFTLILENAKIVFASERKFPLLISNFHWLCAKMENFQ